MFYVQVYPVISISEAHLQGFCPTSLKVDCAFSVSPVLILAAARYTAVEKGIIPILRFGLDFLKIGQCVLYISFNFVLI